MAQDRLPGRGPIEDIQEDIFEQIVRFTLSEQYNETKALVELLHGRSTGVPGSPAKSLVGDNSNGSRQASG